MRAGRSTRLKWLDLHNLLGIVTLVWAFVVGFTGVINELSTPLFRLWQSTELASILEPYKGQGVPAELSSAQAAADTARKALPGNQVLAIRRIIEQRRTSGKAGLSGSRGPRAGRPVTADALVRAYRRETDRQKLLVKKASLAQSRLLFVVNGLRQLLDDDHFVTLLRAESMHTLPRPLAERLGRAEG